jgi:hypothetical protein
MLPVYALSNHVSPCSGACAGLDRTNPEFDSSELRCQQIATSMLQRCFYCFLLKLSNIHRQPSTNAAACINITAWRHAGRSAVFNYFQESMLLLALRYYCSRNSKRSHVSAATQHIPTHVAPALGDSLCALHLHLGPCSHNDRVHSRCCQSRWHSACLQIQLV